ncbi:MotA/TolQ/ExbB proton channel family protein [Puniceicoccaceae bacterium K14]|nr:MotA/TolQ/ExbB proton channel family protein [Puniceicoccaceae bacterium K14]
MIDILKDAGIFVYPLTVCSLLGGFIIFERLFSLRRGAILPTYLVENVVSAKDLKGDRHSSLGRIIDYWHQHKKDDGAVKAYARLEVNRMERGLVFLEIIIGAAPLLGLLGTVTGLVTVFGNVSADTGLPDPAAFTQGIALALTTTVIGLAVAIPCLIANGYLQRRVETYAVQMESLLEQMGLKDI